LVVISALSMLAESGWWAGLLELWLLVASAQSVAAVVAGRVGLEVAWLRSVRFALRRLGCSRLLSRAGHGP